MKNIVFGEGYTNNLDDEKMETEINTGGMLKMNTKKLLMFGMILLGIFVMANSASAATINQTTWVISPSFQNNTVQNGANVFFNLTYGAGLIANESITNVNITLPSGFSFVSGSNGTTVAGASFSNTTNTLVWTLTAGGLLNGSGTVAAGFQFNATISVSGDSSVSFVMNSTNTSGSIYGNSTTITVDNLDFSRAMFTTQDTIDVYFANNNISSADYTKFVSNASKWVATAASVDTVNPKLVHLTVANLSSADQLAGTTNDLNISAGAAIDLRTGFNNTLETSGAAVARSLIPGFYTKSSAGSRYGYGVDSAETNRSLIKNAANNISLTMNSGAFPSASYKIQGMNSSGSWVDIIGCQPFLVSSTSNIAMDSAITSSTNLSVNTTDYRVGAYIYNVTGCTGTYQLLEMNLWTEIYTIEIDTSSITVGSNKNLTIYVKNQTGVRISPYTYVNISGASGLSPYTQQVLSTGSFISLTPEYAGNITVMTVNDNSGNLVEPSGKLGDTRKIAVNPATLASSQIVLTSTPANIYKYFNTNVTINVTLLNQTITGFNTYKNNITYNVTLTAGTLNVSNSSVGQTVNITTGFFAFTNDNNTLENFNGTKVGTGNVSISVNVLLDVNRDGVWDYNTTNSAAGTVRDAGAINIISITPSTRTIFGGVPNTVTFDVQNQTANIIPFNATLTSTTYFYNGSTTTAITTISAENTSGGQVTFTITPEQNGTIAVSITSGGLTAATDSLNVTGAIVARSLISPALGTKLTYNDSYTFQIAVRRADGANDPTATINITSGVGYSIKGTSGNLTGINASGAIYQFTLKPTATGYLNLTVIGSDGYNATFINAYEVEFQKGYTILPTYAGAAVTTLTAGLNNTINITIRNISNNALQGGNLTITYYNASSTQLSTGSVGIVTNFTTITTVVPATASTALFAVSNTSASTSGNLSLSVAVPTISVSNVLIMNSTSVLVNKNNPSNLVVINNTVINLTFTLGASYAEGLVISLYQINTSNGLAGLLATNTSATVVQLTSTVIGDTLTTWAGLNASAVYVLINNSNGVGWNLLNITVAEPTITTDKLSVPLTLNSTVIINVSAYSLGVAGLNVTVKNSTNSTLASNITGSNGVTQLVIAPSSTDTLYIWINGVRTTKTMSATSTLAVTYSPSTVYTDTPLILYVRPYGSTTDLVADSYLSIQAPGAIGSTLYPATNGIYTISSPLEGVYKVTAEKTSWTTSASVYITVLSTATRTNFANVTPSVTSITVNVSSSFTVTVTNSTSPVDSVTVALSGAGVSTSATTNASGIASFSGITATSTGTITVTASKTGYNNMTATITVSGLSSFTSVTANPTSIYTSTPTGITVTVLPALESVNVSLSGAGVSISALTNASGIAAFTNVNATSAGTITVTASKTGYNSISTTITAISLGASNLTVTASPSSITLGDVNVTVTITVINATSSENVSNANVSISGAGITTASALTVNGTATFTTVTPTSEGTITVTVTKSGYNDKAESIAVVTTTTTTTTTSTTSTSTTSTTTTSTTTTSTTTTSTTTTTLPACKGDANNDGIVSDFELLNYIDSWAKGEVGDFDLLAAIDSWANGHC